LLDIKVQICLVEGKRLEWLVTYQDSISPISQYKLVLMKSNFTVVHILLVYEQQCFDAVGWVAGKASGL